MIDRFINWLNDDEIGYAGTWRAFILIIALFWLSGALFGFMLGVLP